MGAPSNADKLMVLASHAVRTHSPPCESEHLSKGRFHLQLILLVLNNFQLLKPAYYRVEQKNLAKFSDTCSVRADGLCVGSPRLVNGREGGKFKHARIFWHHAVRKQHGTWNNGRNEHLHLGTVLI